jgi:hypothetical protein
MSNAMHVRRMGRRQWIKALTPLAGLMAAGYTSGCSGADVGQEVRKTDGPPDCNDLKGLSEDDRKAREALGYEASATDPERRCSGCALYVPPKEGGCAGCMLFKGPVLPEGSCIQFQPRPA